LLTGDHDEITRPRAVQSTTLKILGKVRSRSGKGHMKKFVVALAASLAIFFGIGGAAHAQTPAPTPYVGTTVIVTVSPPTAVPGGTITVTITNCTPGEIVTVSVGGVSVQVTCDAVGVASASVSMPTTPGTYTGTATGSISGVTTTFTVTVMAPVTPPGGLPATGSGGIDTTTGIAAGLFAIGLGLFGVAQLRRRQVVAA
jgi:hypothetical protein